MSGVEAASTGGHSASAKESEAQPCEQPDEKIEILYDEKTTEDQLDLPKDCFLLPKQNPGFQIPYYLSSEAEASKIRPPAVVKTWEQRYGELDEKQKQAFIQFKEKVTAAEWFNAEKHDDWCILRYLIARSFDCTKALAMLEKSVKWRTETGADDWKCDACWKDPTQHCGQFVGWDNEHRPVMMMSMRWGPERKHPLQHMVACFNHLIKQMPVGVEKWVCVTDFETYSHLKDGKPSMGLSVIRTIQDHYPERLGKMLLVNPPTMFWMLYKLFYPAIDPVTREKVDFTYSEDKPSAFDIFPKLFPKHLCGFLYDTYNRSKHNLPAKPLVWYPDPTGYPTNYEERKEQMKNNKDKLKQQKKESEDERKAEKKEAEQARKAEKEAEKEGKKQRDNKSTTSKSSKVKHVDPAEDGATDTNTGVPKT